MQSFDKLEEDEKEFLEIFLDLQKEDFKKTFSLSINTNLLIETNKYKVV